MAWERCDAGEKGSRFFSRRVKVPLLREMQTTRGESALDEERGDDTAVQVRQSKRSSHSS